MKSTLGQLPRTSVYSCAPLAERPAASSASTSVSSAVFLEFPIGQLCNCAVGSRPVCCVLPGGAIAIALFFRGAAAGSRQPLVAGGPHAERDRSPASPGPGETET